MKRTSYEVSLLQLLTFKYFPQYPVLTHPQSTYLPYGENPRFTAIQNSR